MKVSGRTISYPFYDATRKNKLNLKRATQLIKILALLTNNAEQLCRQRKEANTLQNCALVCVRFLASTGSTSDLFCLFQCDRVNFALTKY